MQKYYVQVFPNGNTFWYSDPECEIVHRENGPAVEYANGTKVYYQNCKRHRLDGPAIEYDNGDGEYWIDGVQYTKEEFISKTQPVKELTIADVEKLLGYQVKIVKE